MKKKNILIVEDEQIIAENLRIILIKYGYNFVDIAMDDVEAQDLFAKTCYQLVLMDINLGCHSSIDGIDLIKLLSQEYNFSYLYITANADKKTLEKAKSTNPIGYVVKPFIHTSIYANVEIALNSFKEEACFTFSNKGMHQQILLSKITCIKADGSYIKIHSLLDDCYLVRKTLTQFKELYNNEFIRIHKSLLINISYIESYNSKTVNVNGERLPLGRAYKSSFLEEIKGLSFL
jgi:DNA-binding LytR/AlgR family response regulator